MRQISRTEVHAIKVAELGLDPDDVDLSAPESLASALRRAASLLCPCQERTLVRAVAGALDGLVDEIDDMRDAIEGTVEALVAHGDLLELRDIGAEPPLAGALLLYAAPPSFIARRSGAVLLLGVAPDHASPLPEAMTARIRHVGHVRRLHARPGEDLPAELQQLGLVRLSPEAWLELPERDTPAQYVARMDSALEGAEHSGAIDALKLLDPARPVRYYRGRWIEPTRASGRFVGRRAQAYGADLWCYVEVEDGAPLRFIDLPLAGRKVRGCDDAWQLQLALDAHRGSPQVLRRRPGPAGSGVIELFSPIPMWARRRWDAIGELVPAQGCLLAYRFEEHEIDEELRFARERLWLSDVSE